MPVYISIDLDAVDPAYDPSQITALLVTFLGFDLLNLMGDARRRRRG